MTCNVFPTLPVSVRPLTWDELEPLLADAYPDLHASFRAGRRPWNRRPEEQQEQEEAAAAAAAAGSGGDGGLIQDDGGGGGDGGEGWQVAGRGKRNRNRDRRFSDLVAQDWLEGYPELDWRRGRLAGAGFPPPGAQQTAVAAGTPAAHRAGQGACVATATTCLQWMRVT